MILYIQTAASNVDNVVAQIIDFSTEVALIDDFAPLGEFEVVKIKGVRREDVRIAKVDVSMTASMFLINGLDGAICISEERFMNECKANKNIALQMREAEEMIAEAGAEFSLANYNKMLAIIAARKRKESGEDEEDDNSYGDRGPDEDDED